MVMNKKTIKKIDFYYRPETSDLKSFEEVIGRDVYQKKGIKIEKGEHWIDAGANVGAFSLLACKLGAEITAFEPDPFNFKLLKKNIELNNFNADLRNVGLVHNNQKKANLYVGNNGNVWRNSMIKNWNGKGVKVDCVNFDENVKDGDCVKMDIEGLEMPILENTNKVFKKLVFEWSFDIDPSLARFWNIIDKLKENYEVASFGNAARYKTRDYNTWQKSWFPACINIYCKGKKWL